MCIGYFLVLLDVTIVNVALPRIGSDLGADVAALQWVVDGYALALASLMLTAGTVGDLHGHKRVVLGGLALFGIASLGCGLAPGTAVLIAFRVVQGVGAAVMLPGTLAVIAHAYPDGREQAKAIGIWAGIGSVALPVGPLLGGALTQALSWRAIFFLNVPLVAAALVVARRVVSETREPQGRRLDVPGAVLGAGALAALVFACIRAGQSGLGTTVVVASIASIGLGAAFIRVERAADDPLLPFALFRRPAFLTANVVAGTMNLATLGLLFVITLYLQGLRHRSPLTAGIELFPLFVPLSLLAPLGGRITARVGPRWPMSAGLAIGAVGVALLARLDASSSYRELLPSLLLWGVGLALLTPAVVGAAIRAVPAERAGLASAVNNTARQAGGAIGIAAFGALAGSPTAERFLPGLRAEALIAAGLWLAAAGASLSLIRRLPGN
jgi:MFS transporter, DHA2 family, methylenomycin A resistance protein